MRALSFMHRPPPILALAALLAGCGDFGLVEYDEGSSAGALIAVSPSGDVRFTTASPFGQGTDENLTIRAAGDEPITVTDMVIEGSDRGNFELGDVSLPARLQPDGELDFALRFTPDAVGGFSATLVIETNSTDPVERRLSGQGCNDTNRDGRCDPSGPEPIDSGAPEG